MWHIYISIAVLFRGAFCNPVINTAEHSDCTVVIKRFGEQVRILEVEWNSTIHLICDASCVGPGPQPGLTWFYIEKNQSNLIHIEKLFRSPKFETSPNYFHRKNELVIRDFGPNEETEFICRGTIREQLVVANVSLIGTDCLLKYNFRCQSGNKCIDRGYLCNQNNECPDGEDEVGCASCRVDQFTCTDGNCLEKNMRCDGIPHCEDGSDEIGCPSCRVDQFTCADGNCVEGNRRCDRIAQCEDRSDEIGCPNVTCMSDAFWCENQRECLSIAFRCNGIPDCEDESDEAKCEIPIICSEGKKGCKDLSKCIDDSQICNGVQDCADGGDEKDCDLEIPIICSEGKKGCKDLSKCIDDLQICNGVQDCADGGDEKDCDLGTYPQTSKSSQQKNDGSYDVADGKEKKIMVSTRINDDGDSDPFSVKDSVSDNTEEFTDTTPFDYYLYA